MLAIFSTKFTMSTSSYVVRPHFFPSLPPYGGAKEVIPQRSNQNAKLSWGRQNSRTHIYPSQCTFKLPITLIAIFSYPCRECSISTFPMWLYFGLPRMQSWFCQFHSKLCSWGWWGPPGKLCACATLIRGSTSFLESPKGGWDSFQWSNRWPCTLALQIPYLLPPSSALPFCLCANLPHA